MSVLVGEDADDLGAALDLADHPLQPESGRLRAFENSLLKVEIFALFCRNSSISGQLLPRNQDPLLYRSIVPTLKIR